MAVLTFGEFRLDTINKRLWRGEQPVELSGVYLNVLCHMVEHSMEGPSDASGGRLVTKRELRDLVWPDVQVSEETLRSCMSTVRKALGDDPQQPRYIRTQNKEGWRFMMKVASSEPRPMSAGSSPQPASGPYDPHWYVDRPDHEQEILHCLQHPGRPVVVYGPQGCGKTTLVNRVLATAGNGCGDKAPLRVIRVSLRSLSKDHLSSLDTMLHEVGRLLLDPDEEEAERLQELLHTLWAKGYDAKLKLKRLIRGQILKNEQLVYLVFSNVEYLASWPFQDSWFDMLRAWQEADGMSALRLILETALPPWLFPLGDQSPFWTKARRIDVKALDSEQIAHMAELYSLQPSQSACKQLRELVGGLALLCRHALYRAAMRKTTLEEVLKEYHADTRSFGVFSEHLEDLQQWLAHQQATSSAPARKGTVPKHLRDASRGVPLSNEQAWPLVRKGVIEETEDLGVYRLRCKLYEDFVARAAP